MWEVAVLNVFAATTSLEQLAANAQITAPSVMVPQHVQAVSVEDMELYVRVFVKVLV